MTIPQCDPEQTILQTDLDKAPDQVLKISYVYTEEGAYLMYVLKSKPGRELYLTTRRERTRPKLFVDQNLLMADLHKRYPGLVFEATTGALLSAPTADQAANSES